MSTNAYNLIIFKKICIPTHYLSIVVERIIVFLHRRKNYIHSEFVLSNKMRNV